MHRIDTPGATVANRFQNGNPFAAIPSTIVGAKWLNAVQEEISGVIEGQGLTLSDQDEAQLTAALTLLIAARVEVHTAHRVDIIAPSGLTAGQGLLLVDLFGVVEADALLSAPAVLQVLGVFTLPKTSANVIAAGQRVYWNNGAGEVTTSSSGNHLIGAATVARGAGTTTVDVRLNGAAVAAS